MKLHRTEVALELKEVKGNTISGYASVFGNMDANGDIVAAGAFAATLASHRERGSAPAMLWQHNPDFPIGRWSELAEDERGLRVTGQFAETQMGQDTAALVRMGAITGLSIGYRTRKAVSDETTGARRIEEAELWEISLVTFPANADTHVLEVNSAEIGEMDVRDIEHMLRDADMSRRASKAVIARLLQIGGERDAADRQAAADTAAGLRALSRAMAAR